MGWKEEDKQMRRRGMERNVKESKQLRERRDREGNNLQPVGMNAL